MVSNTKPKLKDQITGLSELMEYLHRKALGHKTYRVYSNAEYLNSWIAEDGLFLSDGASWNDVQDRILFQGSDNERRFGICFSFSISENVAMWMLYGGMNHRGVVVPFKKAEINKIIGAKEVQFGSWEGKAFKSIKNLIADNGDFWVELVDMLYYGDSERQDCYDIKRSDERVVGVSKTLIDSIKFAKKAYPWAYENECRLVLHVKRSAIEGLKGNTIKLPLNGTWSEVKQRVVRSPNFEGESEFECSKLKGKIDWDLCRNCNKLSREVTTN